MKSIYPTLTIVLICMKMTHEDAVQELKEKAGEAGEVAIIVRPCFRDRIPRLPMRELPHLPELSITSNCHLDLRASAFLKRYSVYSTNFTNFRFGRPSPLPTSYRTECSTPPPSSWRGHHAPPSSASFRPGHRPSHSTSHRPEWRTSSIIRHYSSYSTFHQRNQSTAHSHATNYRQEWRTSSIIRHYSSYSTNFRSLV